MAKARPLPPPLAAHKVSASNARTLSPPPSPSLLLCPGASGKGLKVRDSRPKAPSLFLSDFLGGERAPPLSPFLFFPFPPCLTIYAHDKSNRRLEALFSPSSGSFFQETGKVLATRAFPPFFFPPPLCRMMEKVINSGLNDTTVSFCISPVYRRLEYDSYRVVPPPPSSPLSFLHSRLLKETRVHSLHLSSPFFY